MRSVYRSVPCYKSPFDLALYLQLLSSLRPRTIIEIGTKSGGSALFFADMLASHGGGRVISIDKEAAPEFTDPRIEFLTGDALSLGNTLSDSMLGALERPWLVVEDSAHLFETSMAVLEFFHSRLEPGDYIVVEDGIVSQLSDVRYLQYENGPNRAVSAFMERHPGNYEIDTTLCDFFGRNVTYNPNGWLHRVSPRLT